MIERLKAFIESLSMSERVFAKKCGISGSALNYYLKGERNPSYEVVEKILSACPELSAEWLTRGKGEMILVGDEEKNKRIDAVISLLNGLKD